MQRWIKQPEYTGKVSLMYKGDLAEYPERFFSKIERRQIMQNWIMKYNLEGRHDRADFYFIIKPG